LLLAARSLKSSGLAALQHFDSRHRDFHQRGSTSLRTGLPPQKSGPVRIAAREGGF